MQPVPHDPNHASPAANPARRRPWLRRLYLTLRTEHTTPVKVAAAVALGVFVGVSPLWGLHFALCVLLATVLAFLAVGAATTAVANRSQVDSLLDVVGPMRRAANDLLNAFID